MSQKAGLARKKLARRNENQLEEHGPIEGYRETIMSRETMIILSGECKEKDRRPFKSLRSHTHTSVTLRPIRIRNGTSIRAIGNHASLRKGNSDHRVGFERVLSKSR